MITTRTLQQWRRDALLRKNSPLVEYDELNPNTLNICVLQEIEYCDKIIRLTGELLDLNLLKKGGKS